ncbi:MULTISPECIES: hypothetical protein [unclassified Xanthobacter]|uniref:hypothetical protein n=1 Tax=unclassified Xanthobacter TaxID=2623496 RepID=UPI001F366DCD|nr:MULTISPECIES: hypothetical protein [unclassified Xanthobacter]
MPDFSRFAVFASKSRTHDRGLREGGTATGRPAVTPVTPAPAHGVTSRVVEKTILYQQLADLVTPVTLVTPENDDAGDEARWRDAFEERAAILEYDGGFSRSEAERLARIEIEALRKTSGI